MHATYNFDERKLTHKQKLAQEKPLTRFWDNVKRNRTRDLPLLRAAISNPNANPFFRYDGSNLLVTLDPSLENKRLMIGIYEVTDLDTVNPRRWMATMLELGYEGLDTSRAAARWGTDPKAHYVLPEHGDWPVDQDLGSVFLFGSMREEFALPALIKIVRTPRPNRPAPCLRLLMDQATPQAYAALKTLDTSKLSADSQSAIATFLDSPPQLDPSPKPVTTRAEWLTALNSLVQGKSKPFQDLKEKAPDGEHDIVAVLKPEDLPLLRKVRRRLMSTGNPHVIEDCNTFTEIIWTIIRPQLKLATQNGIIVLSKKFNE